MMLAFGQWTRQYATAIASIVVTTVWMTALVAEYQWWVPALFIGYAVVVPLTTILSRGRGDRQLIERVPPDSDGTPQRASGDEASDH